MRQSAKGTEGKRVFSRDNFARGMYYSNSPIPTTYVKSIVNMDISASGDSLKPRKQYVTHKLQGETFDQMIPYLSRQNANDLYIIGIPDVVNENDYLNDVVQDSTVNTGSLKYSVLDYSKPLFELDQPFYPMDISNVVVTLPKRNIVRVDSVVSVIDGDTVDLEIDGVTNRYRLIGVDTPEFPNQNNDLSEPERWAEEAKTYLQNRLNGSTDVFIEWDEFLGVGAVDNHDRKLVYLWEGDSLINAELLHVGLAEISVFYANRFIKYFDLFIEHRTSAYDSGFGLFERRTYDWTSQNSSQVSYIQGFLDSGEDLHNLEDVEIGQTYCIPWFKLSLGGNPQDPSPVSISLPKYPITMDELYRVIRSQNSNLYNQNIGTFTIKGTWSGQTYYFTGTQKGPTTSTHYYIAEEKPVYNPPVSKLNDSIRLEVLDNNPIEYIEIHYLDGIAFFGRLVRNDKVLYKGLLYLVIKDDIVELHKVIPYNPSISEANGAGFNLLLEDPYGFNSYLGASATDQNINFPEVFGVLAYLKDSSQVVQQASSIKNIDIKALVATPPLSNQYTGYAIRWEYRSVSDNEFTEVLPWTLGFTVDGDPVREDILTMPRFENSGPIIDVKFSLAQIRDTVSELSDATYAEKATILYNDTRAPVSHFITSYRNYLQDEELLEYANSHLAFHSTPQDFEQYGEAVATIIPRLTDLTNLELVEDNGQLFIRNKTNTPIELLVLENFYAGDYDEINNDYNIVTVLGSAYPGVGSNGKLTIPADGRFNLSGTFGKLINFTNDFTIKNLNPTIEQAIEEFSTQQGILTGFRTNATTNYKIDSLSDFLDVKKATRISQFYRQAVLYGDEIGDSVLQFSAFEDLSYMPYPNGSITFPEPIVHVHNHNDRLIVFGRDNIYMLHEGQEPLNLIQSKIYSNLSIKPHEVLSVESVGKDVFFMSGNKGYLIQPNIYTSAKEEVRVIPITEQVERLLESPKEYILNRLITHYSLPIFPNETGPLTESKRIVHVYDGHIWIITNYLLELENSEHNLMVMYLYDTNAKRWRLYDMIGDVQPQYVFSFGQMIIVGNDYLGQFIPTPVDPEGGINIMLDVGYITLDPEHNKRFRTLLLRLNNPGGFEVPSMIDFRVDGMTRQIARELRITIDDTGEVSPVVEQIANMDIANQVFNKFTIPSTTVAGGWALDKSRLPRMENLQLRFGVSGRGKAPNFVFAARTSSWFELLGYAIVYKKKGV